MARGCVAGGMPFGHDLDQRQDLFSVNYDYIRLTYHIVANLACPDGSDELTEAYVHRARPHIEPWYILTYHIYWNY